jgi:hypothetical protein
MPFWVSELQGQGGAELLAEGVGLRTLSGAGACLAAMVGTGMSLLGCQEPRRGLQCPARPLVCH